MFLWPDAAACPDVNEPPLPKSPTEDNSSPCVPGSPQSSCFVLRSGLVSIPALTHDKFPLSHPKSCVFSMVEFRIGVSKLGLGTGATTVDSPKPALRRAGHSLGVQPRCGMAGWKFQEYFETSQSWRDPSAVGTAGAWESWGCGRLQECAVRFGAGTAQLGRLEKDCKGLGKHQLKQHKSLGWFCAGEGAGILVGPFQGRAFHDSVKSEMWQK